MQICFTVFEACVSSSFNKLSYFLFSFMYLYVISTTHLGMVAENRRCWGNFYVWECARSKINSISSLNPFSSIKSASSMQIT